MIDDAIERERRRVKPPRHILENWAPLGGDPMAPWEEDLRKAAEARKRLRGAMSLVDESAGALALCDTQGESNETLSD